MITATVSFTVVPGKNSEAVEYLRKVVQHIKRTAGTDLQLVTQLGGPAGHYVVVGTYASLNAWDEARTKATADPTLQKMQAEHGHLFIPGSINSGIFQTV